MPITSLLDLHIAPESVAGAPEFISGVLAGTRSFDGCLGVEVLLDCDDPAHFLLLERWESLAHDDVYRAWRTTPEGSSGLGSILAGPPVLTRFEATAS